MFARLVVVALALAVSHAFPQHGYVNFGRGGYGGGFGGYGGYRGHVAAAIPVAQKVAVAPVVAKAVPVEPFHEERDGDHTRGYYTLHEPDGTILTVHYTVDGHSGFNAVVERTGHAAHPQHAVHAAAVPLRKVY
ncbi:hypothetical protein J437_LFUL015574 [Ladona fulva]|uniref:Uncharacterized protein n=1 Tax=Ladona fulva TaxID=123851 RepID=A0A8K0KJV4_LADFU|nr:hypothetical protein J437_LFUL015574 [Ladona fulva]